MNRKKAASEHLKNGGIVTLDEMINRFGFSRTGTFNFFRRENCYSSINFKGQYHIKNSCLKFNRHGLAKKDEKIFSKHGNLLQTITGLIENSDTGLTVAELNSLVATTVHMQCRRLYAKKVIFRKKFNGVYYYFSADQEKRTIQMQGKKSLSNPVKLNDMLETETTENMQDIVKVLVTCVKHPELPVKGIALSLCRRGNDIRTKQVAEILNKYGIAKKKLLTMLFIIISLRGYLNTPSHGDYYNYIPEALTLELTCGELKNTRKSRFQQRKIRSTRAGELALNYQTAVTPDGNRIVPKDLTVLAAPGMTFAYDTIFTVIELRYLQLMQRTEIQQHILQESGFYISTGSISELSLQGLAYLEQCHFNKSEKLAEYYRKECFIIHLDGTNEGGMYNHFVVRNGITGNVLYAEKIVSESEKSIRSILVKVKTLFGTPDAVISDMSAAIIKAVKAELRGVPHRLCHFHFLKAVGISVLEKYHKPVMISVKRQKDMLAEQRRTLETELKLLQQRPSGKNIQQAEACQWAINLIDYIRDYEKDMSGEGFPFDLPAIAFYERCEQAFKIIEKIMSERERSRHFGSLGQASSTLCFIRNRIQEFMGYCHINQIRNLNDIFMELRNIIHPKSATEQVPLNWGMANNDIKMENIAEKLKALQIKAARFANRKHSTYQNKAWKAVNSRLVKYNEALNPIITFRGNEFILPRTNNLSETGFRDCKRRARRTTGIKRLSSYMDNLPPQYFYTFNLEDQDYIKTVFGEQEIFDSFHYVEHSTIKATVAEIKEQRKSPKQINHKLIRSDEFFELLSNHFILDKKKKPEIPTVEKKQAPRQIRRKKVA